MLSSETRGMQCLIVPVFMIHVDALRMGGSVGRVFYLTTYFRTELLFLAKPVTVDQIPLFHS